MRASIGCIWVLSLVCLCLTAGCKKSRFDLVPVDGTVKFKDGTVPQGAKSDIRFEPFALDGKAAIRAATGRINPDGTFKLSTIKPDDGAAIGDYKVVLIILKRYDGSKDSPVNAKYHNVDATPLKATVTAAGPNHFDLEVDK